ncbi:MAG: glycosyltransferase family 2 protein [Pseudomonadota bacterium]
MIMIEVTFWAMAALLIYIYAGYPLLLTVFAKIRPRPVELGTSSPAVTLVISAFNEEDVIAEKLENSLAVDYPHEKLEIIVVSDASDDRTDEIVKTFMNQGVILLRMTDRGGKTLGLNEAVAKSSGEILVFSDANAMYQTDSVRMLVRNFEDLHVGAVVGESTYEVSTTDAEKSESAYWKYETAIKRLESEIGSTVGGDGAIYAIRKELYQPMAADALSDFVNPLQIVAQRRRCIYEQHAISAEEAAGSYAKEFRRKIRIVNRAWRAMMSMKFMLNPFRFGLFAWALISHKLLRWLAPIFLFTAFVANVALIGVHPIYIATLVVQVSFYGLALLGAAQREQRIAPIMYIPYYFCLVNIASARGIFEAYRGKTYATWSTARAD